jgi:hypothetical protein
MIGDRETPPSDAVGRRRTASDADGHDLPPVDACLLMDSPDSADGLRLPQAWIERRDRYVVVRHCFPAGDATTETPYPTVADALRAYARQVGVLKSRGYTDATADW